MTSCIPEINLSDCLDICEEDMVVCLTNAQTIWGNKERDAASFACLITALDCINFCIEEVEQKF